LPAIARKYFRISFCPAPPRQTKNQKSHTQPSPGD
jgi:hypothetical protein